KISPQPLPAGAILCGAFVLAVAAVIFAPRRRGGLLALVAGVFLSGIASYEINRSRIPVYDTLPAREARLTLCITHTFPAGNQTEPPSRQNNRPAVPETSGLARVTDAEPHLLELLGQRVYFSVSLPPGSALTVPENTPSQIIRTAEISVIGMLAPLPRRVATDSFDGYLVSSGMNFKLTHGRLLALEKTPSATATFYERARLRFSEILSTGLARRPKQAGTLRAMVLGQKQDIDEQQNALFLGSGTMHLFAISGLHIATIATGIQFLLLFLRLPSWIRLVAGTFALYLYVQITGASPSAMRAFVMVALLQASFQLRLPVNGIATLTFAALVTLLAAPMQLFSASFQMSYGIVAALLLYGLPLGEGWLARRVLFRDVPAVARTRFQRFLIAAHRYLISVLGIGIAASLVSAICGTIYFKLFTPGSLLANLLLIPAAMLVIFAGFLSLLFGLTGLTPLSVLFNHSAALLLLMMEESLQFFLKIPGVSTPAQFSPAWLGYGALALLLASMLHGYAKKWTLRRGGFWTPVAVVVVALALCASHG
ncbi:MAG: ComEC/Rec2 family competence protein, partial [Opitutaceae bacterium]|nr:ComEC/Rec2 family competence protein [Opitutaceae bacterium]